jgi:hypothetical protein
MKLREADKFKPYPKFKTWLYGLAKHVKGNQKVLAALMKFGKLTEDDVQAVLSLSSRPPSLDLDSFWHPSGRIRYAVTIFEGKTDLIILNQGMAELFEKDASWAHVIEASLLHELVHRGLMIGKDPAGEHDDGPKDRGTAFEREAYGTVVEASCAQKIELRRVTNNWKPDVTGVFNFYDHQCGIETTEGKSKLKPF